ncbi:MAG: tetratricopeptide repeat protein, partial [Myxococcota bacterium]
MKEVRMVEVRPEAKNPGLWALVLVLLLLAGCAKPGGIEFGPDRVRHRNLLAAQQARPTRQTEQPAAGRAGEKLREGDRLRRSGSDQRALFRYLEAHRIDPTNPSARERIAFIHLDEEPERSRSIFEEVLEEDPSSEIAHLGLGLAELGLGNLNAARASLETARSLAPASPEVRSALGSVYDRLGLREQARAELSRARELRPRDPRIL